MRSDIRWRQLHLRKARALGFHKFADDRINFRTGTQKRTPFCSIKQMYLQETKRRLAVFAFWSGIFRHFDLMLNPDPSRLASTQGLVLIKSITSENNLREKKVYIRP